MIDISNDKLFDHINAIKRRFFPLEERVNREHQKLLYLLESDGQTHHTRIRELECKVCELEKMLIKRGKQNENETTS